VTEDATTPNLTDSGSLTITDADTDPTNEAAFDTTVTSPVGTLGSLSINASGNWNYSVANADVQYLAAGATKLETFTVTSLDGGTTHEINVTITGTNDRPVVSDVIVFTTENNSDVIGSFVVSDADTTDTHTFNITSIPSYGSIVNNNDGTFTFSLGNDFDDLAENESRDVSITYTGTDNSGTANDTSADTTVTITGQ
jgi:VCBS repeat-containing protein